MADSTTTPSGIDAEVPAAARIYDYWLGGLDNFAADRIAANAVAEAAPEAPLLAVENRKFLRRGVRHLAAEAGIDQFLDIGTGLPTQGNVHQVAQVINPATRVVYVDNDPMVLAHSRALKTGSGTAVIQADLREPEAILNHPSTRQLIDFSRPLALLLAAVLHFIGDADDPQACVALLREALPAGSFILVSHVTGDIHRESAMRAAAEYKKAVPDATMRSRAEILRFFGDLELIEPGLVPVPHWRPDEPPGPDADKIWVLGGVGCKADPAADRM